MQFYREVAKIIQKVEEGGSTKKLFYHSKLKNNKRAFGLINNILHNLVELKSGLLGFGGNLFLPIVILYELNTKKVRMGGQLVS